MSANIILAVDTGARTLALEHLKVSPKWIQREAEQSAFLVGGEIILYPKRRKVYARETPIELCNKDFDILQYFIRNTGNLLSHEQIFRKIWGREFRDKDHKRLWNHVYTLRREIETATGSSEYIRTEKDYGYRFLPPCNTIIYAAKNWLNSKNALFS